MTLELAKARAAHLAKVARWNLPASAHFDQGWKARQVEIDDLNDTIKTLAKLCEDAEAIACRCIRGECAEKKKRTPAQKDSK